MSKKGEIVIKKCNTCGRAFESPYSGGAINCPECTRDKKKQFERIYTKDTIQAEGAFRIWKIKTAAVVVLC